jgi:amidase
MSKTLKTTKTFLKTGQISVALLLVALLTACVTQTAPSSSFSVVEASIAGLHSALQTGQTSCTAVVRAELARIKAYDRSTGLHAIVQINPKALYRAKALDKARKTGQPLGPLYCVPVVIKDNFDTHDLRTTGGSIALKDNIPPDDAFMVRKLREAGAIVIAKTNMAEWAFSPRETISSSYGTTANAYDRTRVPAGSSGGTASAVAASFAIAGLGSDTGNSIRGPSSHLALVGIRSTMGLTSRDGVIPLIADRDIAGPMARSVEDVAQMFNVVAGVDPADPVTLEGKGKKAADYTKFLDKNGLKGARLGVVREFVNTKDADPEVLAVFDQALEDLTKAGAIIVDPVTIKDMKTHIDVYNGCPSFRYDMHNYLKTLGDKAPFEDVKAVLEEGLYGPDAKGGLDYFMPHPANIAPEKWDEPCLRYLNNPLRASYRKDVLAAMNAQHLDALIFPTWSNPPAHLDKGRKEYKGDNSQSLAPSTGMPAITVPMGYSYENLPAGLQMVARPYAEGTLFKLAYAYEQATHHRKPPEGFEELSGK